MTDDKRDHAGEPDRDGAYTDSDPATDTNVPEPEAGEYTDSDIPDDDVADPDSDRS